jgi:hypothetical protein
MFTRDGRRYSGKSHKMPNGEVHSGASHSASSQRLFKSKEEAMAYGKKSKGKKAPKPAMTPKKSMAKKKKKGY